MKTKRSAAPSPLAAYSIGQKMKTLRTTKGLTLSRLAAETRLSTALLSKLETEHMIPTLQTLHRISRVYGVDLAYFFATVTQHSLALTRHAHIADNRRDQASARETPLHHPSPQSSQISKVVEIPAGASWTVGDAGVRTELTAYLIDGTLRLSIADTEEMLSSGDCVVLDTDAAIIWSALDARSRLLAVFAKSRPD